MTSLQRRLFLHDESFAWIDAWVASFPPPYVIIVSDWDDLGIDL